MIYLRLSCLRLFVLIWAPKKKLDPTELIHYSHQNDPLMLPNKLYICIFLSKVTFNVITINNGNRIEWSPICLGNSTVSRGIWDKYHQWYFKIHQNITSRRSPRFLSLVFSSALSIERVFSSFSLVWATHDSTSASLDWEDVALSSGKAISPSVATTVSVSQPVFLSLARHSLKLFRKHWGTRYHEF